jgi:hypothetical protein
MGAGVTGRLGRSSSLGKSVNRVPVGPAAALADGPAVPDKTWTLALRGWIDWIYFWISGISSHAFDREYVSHETKDGGWASSDDQEVMDRADCADSATFAVESIEGLVLGAETELCSSSRKTRVGFGAWLSHGNICATFVGSGFVLGTS